MRGNTDFFKQGLLFFIILVSLAYLASIDYTL